MYVIVCHTVDCKVVNSNDMDKGNTTVPVESTMVKQ